MKQLLLSLLVITFLLQSCKKDELTQAKAYIKNTTTHSIKILFYKSGLVSANDTIKLTTNQEIEIANGPLRGLIKAPAFNSNYFGSSNDSMVVIFDNLYRVTHYGTLPINLTSKYYDFASLRHIGNPKSYIFTSTQVASTKLENVHRYEFVEADYNYAR